MPADRLEVRVKVDHARSALRAADEPAEDRALSALLVGLNQVKPSLETRAGFARHGQRSGERLPYRLGLHSAVTPVSGELNH